MDFANYQRVKLVLIGGEILKLDGMSFARDHSELGIYL